MTSSAESWAETAHERLRTAGYRLGSARTLVIELLGRQRCCITAQEIHDALHASGQTTGLASVYRIVDTLAEQGLVQRVDIGDGIARYEPSGSAFDDHHHHLVCDACGKVEAFSDDRLETAIRRVQERSGFVVEAHEVVLRGACATCR